MARGQEEKLIVINKIKEVFPEAFEYDKTIRIPIGDIQIKVALTAAKDNVEPGGDVAVPGVKATKVTIAEGAEPVFEDVSKTIEPSQSELDAVNNLMSQLGL
ncbi:MAG: hypothetical protein PUJ51_10380 [Clostridiales bacterium]|nr:hypothetical protein [Clostridiales bacterium]